MRISIKDWLRQRREPWTRVFYESFRRWRTDGMEARRMEFERLGPASVVFDIGGFRGDWTAAIMARYGATVHIFEPHPVFVAAIRERFKGKDRICVHDMALGRSAGDLVLSDDGDASSAVRKGSHTVVGRVVAVRDFFATQDISRIDLMKVNIEGGEYDLIPALVEAEIMERVGILQVQFHLFAKGDIARRNSLRDLLTRTHECDWSYDFVWEQWSLRSPVLPEGGPVPVGGS